MIIFSFIFSKKMYLTILRYYLPSSTDLMRSSITTLKIMLGGYQSHDLPTSCVSNLMFLGHQASWLLLYKLTCVQRSTAGSFPWEIRTFSGLMTAWCESVCKFHGKRQFYFNWSFKQQCHIIKFGKYTWSFHYLVLEDSKPLTPN